MPSSRSIPRRPRRRITAGLTVAVVAIAVTFAALSAGDAPPHGSVAASQTWIRHDFGVLRSSSRPGDAVSAAAQPWLSRLTKVRFTTQNLTEARQLSSRPRTWLVPSASDLLCILRLVDGTRASIRSGFSVACARQAEATAGRFLIAGSGLASRATQPFVLGVVPDGVRVASIVSRGGKRTRLTIARNRFFASGSRLERIEVQLPNGHSFTGDLALPQAP
jgi:hypothetical protein